MERGRGHDDDNESEDEDVCMIHFPNPLALIDKECNLDRALSCKNIGESMHILCPNLPGLPGRSQEPYHSRKNMAAEDKAIMVRKRNRINAGKTRRRKKIYNKFLDAAIVQLSEMVQHRTAQMEAYRLNNSIHDYQNIGTDGVSTSHREQAVPSFAAVRANEVSAYSTLNDRASYTLQPSHSTNPNPRHRNKGHSPPPNLLSTSSSTSSQSLSSDSFTYPPTRGPTITSLEDTRSV